LLPILEPIMEPPMSPLPACRMLVGFALCQLVPLAFAAAAAAENWPGWRGPRGDGTSLEQNIPTQWNGPAGGGIAWKVPVPGVGHSSPVVWGDRVFLVSCLTDTEERVLLCFDRTSGKTLWQTTVLAAPLEKKHTLNSYASGTPATDGERVYVAFLEADFGSLKERTPGSVVVAANYLDGKRLWQVKPGRFASVHGFCSSPVVYKDKVIVNGDHDGDAYLLALDRATGQTVWQVPRENKTRSYCTPIIRTIDGREQMILSGSKCVASYDPNDGSRHWIIDGPTEQFVASIVYNGKLLFMTAGFPEKHMMAIRPDGQGNVTQSHIAWRTTRGCSYVPSPIAHGEYFLVTSDDGVGSCFRAEDGERLWMERMGTHYSTSLTSAGGLVYFLEDNGVMKVVRPGPTLDVVAENVLGEKCYASPAISQGNLFIRSSAHLYCIGPRAGAE
jgi:outer membrane protein assembly factor BamB